MWVTLFTAKSITDTTETSQPAHLIDGMSIHAFEFLITGTGTCDIEVETSISSIPWVSNGVKASGVGITSGPGADGKDILGLRLKPGEFIRFKVVATGNVVITLWFCQK